MDAATVRLVAVEDEDFGWLGLSDARRNGLTTPPGGAENAETLQVLRNIHERLSAAGCRGSWMIVAGREVVGLIGFRRPPNADGEVEIGYGIAESRRGRGFATAAVAALLRACECDPSITSVVAETSVANPASQRALISNGFTRGANRHDADDGDVIQWRRNTKSVGGR